MISDLWYKNAVVYAISVATFMDANGDGIGDLEASCAGSTTCKGSVLRPSG